MKISEVKKIWATKSAARLRKEAITRKNNNEKDQRIKLFEDYTNTMIFQPYVVLQESIDIIYFKQTKSNRLCAD